MNKSVKRNKRQIHRKKAKKKTNEKLDLEGKYKVEFRKK